MAESTIWSEAVNRTIAAPSHHGPRIRTGRDPAARALSSLCRHSAWLSDKVDSPRPCRTLTSQLVSNHFVEPTGQVVAAERIVQLISDELKVLEAANEDPVAGSIRINGSIENNIARLEPDLRKVHVEEFDGLNFLEVVSVNRGVHQQPLLRRPYEGNPIGENELTLQAGYAVARVESGTRIGVRAQIRIEMGILHERAVEIRQPRCLETIGNHALVVHFEGGGEDSFPRAEAKIDAIVVEAVNEFDRILAGIGEIFDPTMPVGVPLFVPLPLLSMAVTIP